MTDLCSLTRKLQNLDLASIAEIHLYKTILKIKSIASLPSLPRYVQTIVETSRKLDPASANVQARLFKSNSAQDALGKSLSGIRAILGIEDSTTDRKRRVRAKDYADDHVTGGMSTATNRETIQAKIYTHTPVEGNISAATEDGVSQLSEPASRSRHDMDGPSRSEIAQTQAELEDGDIDQENYSMYNSGLAVFSSEDSRVGKSHAKDIPEDDLNPESITEPSTDEQQRPPKTRPPKKPPASAITTKTKSTTFLPSLSMAGYWSGSESAEDLSDSGAPSRKNRMGQQARRALWEKKFGEKANHLKKQPRNRDEGWDARRGASARDEKGMKGRGRGRGGVQGGRKAGRGDGVRASGRGPMSSGANSDPVLVKKGKPVADGPLHPSWEAAKKAKEQKNSVPFQGKKVVFD